MDLPNRGGDDGLTPDRIGLVYDRLDVLSDRLRLAGFHVDDRQKLDVRYLLLDLAVRGELPGTVRRVARCLGPVLCRTPAEQDLFPSLLASLIADLPADSTPQGDESGEAGEVGDVSQPAVSTWAVVRYIALQLLMALPFVSIPFIAFWILTGSPIPPDPGPLPPAGGAKPTATVPWRVSLWPGVSRSAVGTAFVIGLPLVTWFVARRRRRSRADRDGLALNSAPRRWPPRNSNRS